MDGMAGSGSTGDKSAIFLADIIEVTEGLESFNKCIMDLMNAHSLQLLHASHLDKDEI